MLRVGYEKCSFKEVKDQILGFGVISFFFFGGTQKRYEIQSCFIWNLWVSHRLTTMWASLVAQR